MTFDESNLEKKLQSVTNSQDSIQTLSLWILHHKGNAQRIIQLWLKLLAKDKIQHRLTLFYLANDVVQHARKKNCRIYLDAFRDVLPEATKLVRDPQITTKIQRVFTIWVERNVYSSEFVDELRAILAPDAEKAKILAEFKLADLRNSLASVRQNAQQSEQAIATMSVEKLESLVELGKLKDRNHAMQCVRELDEADSLLRKVITSLENELEHRNAFLAILERSELFYETQREEAGIVVNAYRNFASRVRCVKEKLVNCTFTGPSIDAPSPDPTDDGPILPSSRSPLPGMRSLMSVFAEQNQEDSQSSLDKRLSNLMQHMPQSQANVQTVSSVQPSVSAPPPPPPPPSLPSGATINAVAESINANYTNNAWSDLPKTRPDNDYAGYYDQHAFGYYGGYVPPPPPPPPPEETPPFIRARENHGSEMHFGAVHGEPMDRHFDGHRQAINRHQTQNVQLNDRHSVQHIQSVVSARGRETNIPGTSGSEYADAYQGENFEPADMEIGNSDEEDAMNRSQNSQRVLKVIETHGERKMSSSYSPYALNNTNAHIQGTSQPLSINGSRSQIHSSAYHAHHHAQHIPGLSPTGSYRGKSSYTSPNKMGSMDSQHGHRFSSTRWRSPGNNNSTLSRMQTPVGGHSLSCTQRSPKFQRIPNHRKF